MYTILSTFVQIALTVFTLIIMHPTDEWKLVDKRHTTRYPPLAFWELTRTDAEVPVLVAVLSCLSYVAFGSIHCVAWSFSYFSREVQILWRAASLTVTVVPMILPLYSVCDKWVPERTVWFIYFSLPLVFIGVLAFIVARLILMVLPFIDLLYLPADTLKLVPWSDFFPHIG